MDQKSRDDFALCTGNGFSQRVPEARQKFVYTSNRKFENKNFKNTMTANINLSYSTPAAIKVQQAENDRLILEIATLTA